MMKHRAILLLASTLAMFALIGASSAQEPVGAVTGQVVDRHGSPLVDAVVFFSFVAGDWPAPAEPISMHQRDLTFSPHVLPILNGSTVSFPNDDPVLHNVFTPDSIGRNFDLGTYPPGTTRLYQFDNPCSIVCDAVMLCNIHPDMEAYVVVLQNPFHARTDANGRYRIADIPVGEYMIGAWHELYEVDSLVVNVEAEKALPVDFQLRNFR
jgi:plastocyanin